MSPSTAQHSSFTDAALPQIANVSPAIATRDDARTRTQVITAFAPVADNSTSDRLAEPLPNASVDEDVEMVDDELPAADPALGVTTIFDAPRRSLFADLGLNARSLKFVGWKEPSPGLSVHTPIYAEASPARQTAFRKSIPQESEELDELEAMMVPASLRQAWRERVNISFDPRPATVKTSKYTTALLTESGVTVIGNINNEARMTHECITGEKSTVALVDEFVGYDNLPGVLAKKAQPAQSINKPGLDITTEEIASDSEIPYLDAKYFDLDSYLEHSQGRKGKKGPGKAKSAPAPARKSRKLPVRPRTGPAVESDTKGQAIPASATTKRARKPLPRLSVIAENEGTDLPDEDVPSPPKTPRGSENEAPRVKSKENPLNNRKWQPMEDNYMLLFYKKVLSVVERGRNIRAPGKTPLTEAFNKFFVGKVIEPDLPVCEPRGEPSIKSKLQMSTGDIKAIRDTTRGLLEGRKGGSLYVPVITQQELEAFMADGSVQVDDPNDAAKNDAKSPKRKREAKDVAEVESKRLRQ